MCGLLRSKIRMTPDTYGGYIGPPYMYMYIYNIYMYNIYIHIQISFSA